MSLSQGAGTGAVGSFLLIVIQAIFFISSLHPSVPASGQDDGAIVDTTWHHCGMSTTFYNRAYWETVLASTCIKSPTQLIDRALGSLSLFF